jgi:dipeptidyl aminopeptidase/acylaminoacyl peptidase
LLAVAFAPLAPAQTGSSYHRPSAALAAVVDAPLTPAVFLSPDKTVLLLASRSALPPVAELAQPELRLAGLRINPATSGPTREAYFTGLVLKPLPDGAEVAVSGLPAAPRIGAVNWSSDSRHLAFTITSDHDIQLWVADVATARAHRLSNRTLSTVTLTPAWVDATTLVAPLVPATRGAMPVEPTVPSGPVVQENLSGKNPARTYPDLLASAYDESLFEHFATADLALVSLDGAVTPLGLEGLFDEASPSPDGRYLLVAQLHRPYSYLVPASRFPVTLTIRDRAGRLRHTVAALPLAENIPIPTNSVRTGPRDVAWRADAPATLSWFEALDGGDAGRAAAWRDEWFTLPAPFNGGKISMQKFALRATGVTWGDDQHALVNEIWTKQRRLHTWLAAPAKPGAAATLIFDRSTEDRYANPGLPVLTRNPAGESVLLLSADRTKMFLDGPGASAEGDRPFLDEFDFATRTARRLWRSTAPHYEVFVAFADDSLKTAITQRESVTEPPNYFLRTLGVAEDAAALRALTHLPDPLPQFAQVKKELITYKRADGVALSGTLYLPPGYQPTDGPLPTLLWAYPREFKDAAAAGQLRDSPYRFARVSPLGPLPFVLAGYAVFDDPAMPIIGRGQAEPNDTYITQLVASAKAAIDELARRGVTDPKRVAVGGHSYGAFMTANLLAHSDLFRAGIAESGAYNRTLTPFGFQSEERTFWQAPEVYSAMSPFNYADKVKDPLLLIHGMADNNQGTFPIQSERFYAALKGHGATTRYVQLPYEAHGYRGRENVLHKLWEMETWLDTYVKPQPKDRAR